MTCKLQSVNTRFCEYCTHTKLTSQATTGICRNIANLPLISPDLEVILMINISAKANFAVRTIDARAVTIVFDDKEDIEVKSSLTSP